MLVAFDFIVIVRDFYVAVPLTAVRSISARKKVSLFIFWTKRT